MGCVLWRFEETALNIYNYDNSTTNYIEKIFGKQSFL